MKDFEKITDLYIEFCLKPMTLTLLSGKIDRFDNIKIIYNYNYETLKIDFMVIRERPETYMINRMKHRLPSVSVFEVERWYDEVFEPMRKSLFDFKWEY